MSFSSNDIPIDDLLDCCRYGELEDICGYLASTQKTRGLRSPSCDDRVDFLAGMKGKFGNTMLHMASANGHIDLVKYLVDILPLPISDRINDTNDEGNTPLHWASMNGHEEVAEFLIIHGADGKTQNAAGFTPLYYAQSAGHDKVVGVLLRLVDYEAEAEDDLEVEEEVAGSSNNDTEGER